MHHACTFGCQKVAGCSDISISPTKVSFDRIGIRIKKIYAIILNIPSGNRINEKGT